MKVGLEAAREISASLGGNIRSILRRLRVHELDLESTPVGKDIGMGWQRYGLLLGVVGLSVVACGPSIPNAMQPVAADRAAGVAIYVGCPDGGGDAAIALRAAIQRTLASLGYRIAAEPAGAEIAVDLRLNVREKQSFWVAYVNGVRKVGYAVRADALTRGDNTILAAVAVEYDLEDGASESQVSAMVGSITHADLVGYVRNRRWRMAAAAQAEAERQRAQEAARARGLQLAEEAAWNTLVVASCTAPTRDDGCDKVKGFLQQFPTGRHAPEAKKVVEDGASALAHLADERDWNAADVSACREPKQAGDCVGVLRYLLSHPRGAHIDESRHAIEAAHSVVEKLRLQEVTAEERRQSQLASSGGRPVGISVPASAPSNCDAQTQAFQFCRSGCEGKSGGDVVEACKDRCRIANPRSACK